MRSGRCALVTGAAKGIGRAVAESLAAEGFDIILHYRNSEEQALALADKLKASRVRALAVRADLTDDGDLKTLKTVCDSFGRPDTLINNAGVSLTKLFQDVTDEEYDYVMDVNARALFKVTRAFLPDMLSARFGRIVNIASIWGEIGGSAEVVYSMSKAAVIGMTKALAKEVAPCGVTVNAVSPGAVDTDMTADLSPEDRVATEAEIPLGRFGKPQEIADIVSVLTKRDSYVTGQVFSVNGGWKV